MIPELPEALRQNFLRHELRTLGDLARMPRHLMARRFGAEGERLCAMARGMDLAPIPAEPSIPAMEKLPELDLFAIPAIPEAGTARTYRRGAKGRWQEARLAA